MKISSLLCSTLFLFNLAAHAATNVPMSVTEGAGNFVGTLYLPDHHTGKIPLVLVVPDWWGKSAYSDKRARMVADELGAAALSIDVYGDGKLTELAPEAMKLATPFYQNPQLGVTRLNAFLNAVPAVAKAAGVDVDMQKIVAIGYCFGGTQVLNLVRSGELPSGDKLAAVVSFHGGLASSLKISHPVTTKILVLHGANDQMVKPAEVATFKTEMSAAKAPMTFISYPGASHAFSNPAATELGKKNGIPVAYNEAADKASWLEFKKFFAKAVK